MINEASFAVVNKGILGAVAGGIAIAIVAVVMFTPVIFHGAPQAQAPLGEHGEVTTSAAQGVVFNLTSVQIKQINDKNATIEIVFNVVNPAKNTLVLEEVRYDLTANGVKLAQSAIGEKLQGFVSGGFSPSGSTYDLVKDLPVTLTDKIQIRKTESLTSIWGGLQSSNVEWRIKGTYTITDPVRAAGQEKNFDFSLK